MTPEQFCYWLQGYLEIQNPSSMDSTQVDIIKDHLKTVFTKVTQDRHTIPSSPYSPSLPIIC